jgi:uncharacterized phiE125 gp8 family phage protein
MSDDYYVVTVNPDPVSSVSLDEAREWVKMDADITADNDLLTALIITCTEEGEDFTNRVFMERTFEGYFAGYQESNCEIHPFIQIRRAPLIDISAVELSVGGSFVAVDSDGYELKQTASYARIVFTDVSVLSGADDIPYPLKVTFTAGYGDADDVPDGIETAIKEYIAFRYENRGDTGSQEKSGMPKMVSALFKRFRILNTLV